MFIKRAFLQRFTSKEVAILMVLLLLISVLKVALSKCFLGKAKLKRWKSLIGYSPSKGKILSSRRLMTSFS
jgi:hypothetical protein